VELYKDLQIASLILAAVNCFLSKYGSFAYYVECVLAREGRNYILGGDKAPASIGEDITERHSTQ
jgi:hypothetical protein